MKLVNLIPLNENGAFGMTPKELANTYSLKMLQQMRDEVMMDMENDPSVEPEGGSQADYYGGTLNGLDQAIALKQPKKDVPYDVAIGRMSRDEFEKSSKFNRMNETTEKAWNAIDVSRKAEKEISNKEWNERTGKKLDILKALNAAGKFKKDFDDERLQGWVDQNYSWQKLSKQFKLNEDNVRKVIRKIIKEQNFDDKLKSFMGADDFEKATNPKLGKLISNSIATIDPEMSYVDFAKGVAQVLIDEYGTHNYEPFIKELKKSLDSTLG